MISKAIARYVRISPKKGRLVVDAIRGKSVDEAMSILMNTNKKASELIGDVLESAYNNAKRKNPEATYGEGDLYISKITIDGGPTLARYRAASMGRASEIRKRTSHIFIELEVTQEKIKKLKESKTKKKTVKKKETVSKRS